MTVSTTIKKNQLDWSPTHWYCRKRFGRTRKIPCQILETGHRSLIILIAKGSLGLRQTMVFKKNVKLPETPADLLQHDCP